MLKKTGLLVTLIGFTASAVTINLTGKVTNTTGKAISGAIVVLAGQNMKDTTDASGAFSFKSAAVSTSRTSGVSAFESVNLNNGVLSLNLSGSSSIKVELFDVHGNLISRELTSAASGGNYHFNLSNRNIASTMVLVRVSIGQKITSFQYFPIGNKSRKLSSESYSFAEPAVLSKVSAIVDTIKVSSTNYIPAIKQLYSYEGTVTIALDSNKLEPFSFFVTSQKALQALSGRDSGFGGDFRFGKTGQGAGLLGADSICQCIAERSMKGSAVKQWRAFLSVEKGPNGTQVNAIDRIGSGPWYDRTGRVVALKLSDLTSGDRPATADDDIKNDLPNEDGVPNHRPNVGSTATVDNHHTVTGSNKQGKLNSATSTCDDWTSVTSTEKPMCGFSWPRGMGGGAANWITGFTANGCKAGAETVDNGGGARNTTIIGSGGGYGGFYCFALVP
jgi:hypothetical protein